MAFDVRQSVWNERCAVLPLAVKIPSVDGKLILDRANRIGLQSLLCCVPILPWILSEIGHANETCFPKSIIQS